MILLKIGVKGRKLLYYGAKKIYPSHGKPFSARQLIRGLQKYDVKEDGTKNMGAKPWNRMSCIYDLFMLKDRKMYKAIVNEILKQSDSKNNLLEIGTGTGILSIMLADYFKGISAVDFSEEMIGIATGKAVKKKLDHIDFQVGDATNLQFEDSSYDNIVIANVLHIMPEPEKALAEIKRVLKDDGILFAPTFTHEGSSKAGVFAKIAGIIGFKAYSKWTQESYKQFLEANGFKVVYISDIKASFPQTFTVCRQVILD